MRRPLEEQPQETMRAARHRILPSMYAVSVAVIALIVALPSARFATADAQQLVLQIVASEPAISRSNTLSVTLTRQNPARQGGVVDLYVGVLCPDGQTLYLFTPSGVIQASTSNLAAVVPLEKAVDLSASRAVSFQVLSVKLIDFMPPPGPYLFFYLALTLDAFIDGVLQPEEIVALATTTVRPETLRSLAAKVGLNVGAAVEPSHIAGDPQYGPTLVTNFSEITPENAMKFFRLCPSATTFNFSGADALVNFAMESGLAIRGHTLVWHSFLPGWLTGGSWTRQQLVDILRDHIHSVVSRYKGKVARWDVVNEALDEAGQLRNSFWRMGIGDDYIEMAFRWANEADPGAKLFYNDFNAEGLLPKSNAVYRLVQSLLAKGTPIHGVGLQMHINQQFSPLPQNVVGNMQRLAALGLQIHVSEMDVRLGAPPSPEALAMQAQVYANVMNACLGVDACVAFTTWGVTDKHSWIPAFFPGLGSALIFDEEYRPKPAYHALLATLRGESISVSPAVLSENPAHAPSDGPSGTYEGMGL